MNADGRDAAPDAPSAPSVQSAPDATTAGSAQEVQGAAGDEPRVVRTAATDRRLALLWDPPAPSGRGRKPRFVLEDVVRAALRVVAREGLEALTMRRVAAELGVGTMTLYTYVPGRAELLDLMVDRVYAELRLPEPGSGWRDELARYAREHHRMYVRHPWVLQSNVWRTPLAPHVLDAQECGLRILLGAGLPARRVVQTLGMIDAAMQGLARAAAAEHAESTATGEDVQEYWESLSAFWVDYFDQDRYPTMLRVYLEGGFDAVSDPLESALEWILDGVGTAIGQAAETH